MNEQLIRIAKQVREDEPFENKEWIEIGFNYPLDKENELEWRASHIIGESLDSIVEQHNYFGKTPQEALDKLEKSLK